MENNSKYSEFSLQDIVGLLYNLTLEDKIQMKETGKPTPQLNLCQTSTSKDRTFKREFNVELYKQIPWLCGCDQTNKLFCFHCLLLAPEKADPSWVKTGVCDLSHLKQKIKKHESSHVHMNCTLDFNVLGQVDIRQQLDCGYWQNIKKHNEQVLKNRYVLSEIINCIKFCGAFELVLRDHCEGESDDSVNPGLVKGLVDLSTELELSLKTHRYSTATVFKGTPKEIQNDLLDCILTVCQNEIKQEITNVRYLSLIADETTDVSSIFQLAVVFRYVLPNGQPVERFWNFVKPTSHNAQPIAEKIRAAVESVIDDPVKLISQSYDGASVMSGKNSGVEKLIKRHYKNAVYIHCYAHQLNLVVIQAASQNQQVRIFFSDLSDIANFFNDAPQRVVFEEVSGKRVPQIAKTKWTFKRCTVNSVHEHRGDLIKCMETIENSSQQQATIIKARAIKRLLEDPTFLFWLKVFHMIMPHVEILVNQLQFTDTVQTHEKVEKFKNSMQFERSNMDFSETEVSDTDIRKKHKGVQKTVHQCRAEAAKEVCDVITTQMENRLSFLTHHSAASLFCAQRFKEFDKTFPTTLVSQTISDYPFLQGKQLTTELQIIYKRKDFRKMTGAVTLLQFIQENNLKNTFTETYKLLLIIATIPMTSAEADRCFPTLKNIQSFLRSTMDQDRLTALAMLSIENDMIRNIPNFNEKVIEVFATKKDRRMDFNLKLFS